MIKLKLHFFIIINMAEFVQLCDKCGKNQTLLNKKVCEGCISRMELKSQKPSTLGQQDLMSDIKSYKSSAPQRHEAFLHSPIDNNILTVPGIGEGVRDALSSVGIDTTHQLLGKYLMLNCDLEKFHTFLGQFSSLSKNKTTVVRAIAEKYYFMSGIPKLNFNLALFRKIDKLIFGHI